MFTFFKSETPASVLTLYFLDSYPYKWPFMCGSMFKPTYLYVSCLHVFLQIWENVQRHVSWWNCAEHPDRYDQERIPVQRTDFWNTEDQRHLWNKVPLTDREVKKWLFKEAKSIQDICLSSCQAVKVITEQYLQQIIFEYFSTQLTV